MATVLIATEKPFSKPAVDGISAILKEKGHTVKLLEKYSLLKDFHEAVADADALIVRSDLVTPEVIAHAPNLKILVRAGAGYDNIDLVAASAKGIVVENTPGQNANAVAELAFGLMLLMARKNYDGSTGAELMGKKLGLHGFGAVGRCMARIAHGFGMEVFAYDMYLSAETFENEGVTQVNDPTELYKTCKYISLHFPATPETVKSIGYGILSNLPKGGVLINTARAEVIDEASMLEMFEKRDDFIYIADVAPKNKAEIAERFAGKFYFTAKKAGAQTAEANSNAGLAAARQINAFFESGDAKFQVNK